MFGLKISLGSSAQAVLQALSTSLAIIEFDANGNILSANENFCRAMGYTLAEIVGQHHRMFVGAEYAQSAEYKAFWMKLGHGEFDAGEYKRIAKGGRPVWIQASYNPVKAPNGRILKIIKAATDITVEKLKNAEFESKLNAISRAQAVIEFTPEGKIITANENFLSVVGYRLGEIQGKHHRMFVEPRYGQSPDYQEFWRKLNKGEFIAAEFNRFGKGGKSVWIQASYNPVFGLDNQVMKIVKFATDISDRVHAVDEISRGLTSLSQNNLEYRINDAFIPAFENLRGDFNLSLEKLQSTLTLITERTVSMREGTREIKSASDDLSRRTEQQAASLEETAAAIGELTSAIKTSADGASHAREVVVRTDGEVKHTTEMMRSAIVAMGDIAKSSQQISQIIGVIDEIAFQTNLLALNAGVEAARAGEAGRGFAVVASEVRALAQRSAEAAKEIKILISASSVQVDGGVKLVGETGCALERIMAQINDVNQIITEIAASAREQAKGVADTNAAIRQMDQVTQRNAAMAQESTALSHVLSQDADQLSHLIGTFKIGAADNKPVAPQRRPAASNVVDHPAKRGVSAPPPRAAPAVRRPQAKIMNGDNDGGWEEF